MPIRFVDGEGVWGSRKLKQVTPDFFQPFYAGMIPLAMANGTFECDAATVQYRVCGFRQAHLSEEFIRMMLDEFERVKLLFRWKVGNKEWGYWAGIEKQGRLPADSQKYKYAKGEPVPKAEFQAWLQEEVQPYQVDPEGVGRLVTELLRPTMDLLGTSSYPLDISERIAGKHCIGKVRVGKVSSADAPVRTEQCIQETVSVEQASPTYLSSLQEQEEPTPVTQGIVPVVPTAKPGPVPVPAKSKAPDVPAYRTVSVQPPATAAATARAIAPVAKPEPWNALDFAMDLFLNGKEPFEGFDPKVVGRCVFHHYKRDPKLFWAKNIHNLDDLKRCLPEMIRQTPGDATVPGGATMIIPMPDPDCTLCGGQGRTFGPHPGYDGIAYQAAFECSCVKEGTKPWHKWKPTSPSDE
jgi:hypothetical protein